MNNQVSFNFSQEENIFSKDFVSYKELIIDRKSKFSASAWKIKSEKEGKEFLKQLKQDKYFAQASHNSYAYRILWENASILEGKGDDGETWAGNCILRELQRKDVKNIILVITRYFWGIYLQADRYKDIIETTKKLLEKEGY